MRGAIEKFVGDAVAESILQDHPHHGRLVVAREGTIEKLVLVPNPLEDAKRHQPEWRQGRQGLSQSHE